MLGFELRLGLAKQWLGQCGLGWAWGLSLQISRGLELELAGAGLLLEFKLRLEHEQGLESARTGRVLAWVGSRVHLLELR